MKQLLASFLIGIFCVGCTIDTDIDDLKTFTEDAYKDQKPEVEPLPPLQPHAVFIYTASDLKDPFDPENLKEKQQRQEVAESDTEGPDRSRRKEPLEQFPLDSLVLRGIMEQGGENWAIIGAPDKSVHRVKEGNFMGEFDGRILSVTDLSLVVSELKRNPVGKWESLESEILLVE
ncbi:MAG: pilus assembly protein PilP [Pseudomonadota bacterium]